MRFNLGVPLEITKSRALQQVDASASGAREGLTHYDTMTYALYITKASEAAQFVSDVGVAEAGGKGVDPANYPMLMAEINVTADSMIEVAQIILTKHEAWKGALAKIESKRLLAKKAIRDAKTAREVAAVDISI